MRTFSISELSLSIVGEFGDLLYVIGVGSSSNKYVWHLANDGVSDFKAVYPVFGRDANNSVVLRLYKCIDMTIGYSYQTRFLGQVCVGRGSAQLTIVDGIKSCNDLIELYKEINSSTKKDKSWLESSRNRDMSDVIDTLEYWDKSKSLLSVTYGEDEDCMVLDPNTANVSIITRELTQWLKRKEGYDFRIVNTLKNPYDDGRDIENSKIRLYKDMYTKEYVYEICIDYDISPIMLGILDLIKTLSE